MLDVTNLVTPSNDQYELAIHGMRNAFKSWDKSDSGRCNPNVINQERCNNCTCNWNGYGCIDPWEHGGFILGKVDRQRLLNLCKAGDPSHRKVLRQLPVIMDITAPLYWWKQMDKYQVGTVTNSESTMHCMVKEPFKIEDFSIEHLDTIEPQNDNWFQTEYFDGLVNNDAWIDLNEYFEEYYLGLLNSLREKYLETKDMNYWYLINELLPQSYNQTRTWSGNYETLLNIALQRAGHKLIEWDTLIGYVMNNVPYLLDIYDAIWKHKVHQRRLSKTNRTFLNVWER